MENVEYFIHTSVHFFDHFSIITLNIIILEITSKTCHEKMLLKELQKASVTVLLYLRNDMQIYYNNSLSL